MAPYQRPLLTLSLFYVILLANLSQPQDSSAQTANPSASSFTYQGQLLSNGSRINATCSFQFTLYDASTGGTIIGPTQTIETIVVQDSYFATPLDFGVSPFGDSVRYLALAVKCPPETSYTSMEGRIPLTATPAALVAQKALVAPWSGLSGIPQNLTSFSNLVCASGQVAKWNGTAWECSTLTATTDTLANLACASGQVAKWNGTAWECSTLATTTDTLASLACASGQVAKWNGTAWECSTLAATTDTLANLSCASGQVAKWNGTAWECGTFATTTDTLANLACASGQVAKWNGTAWACAADTDTDTNTTYTTDASLSLTGTTLGVQFGGTGSATTSARSDHTHTTLDNVPIGATTPSTGKFTTLEGASLKVTGSSPAVGKFLGADANGAATWQALPKLAKVVYVAESGGDFTTLTAALASITDASATKPYLLRVAPGVYNEQVTMKPYVAIEGSGEGITIIKWTGSFAPPSSDSSSATVIGASNAELRFLTVQSACSGCYATTAIYNNTGASPSLLQITLTASGGGNYNYGIYNTGSSPFKLTNATIAATGGTNFNYGVYNGGSSPQIINTTISATGGTNSYGVYNDGGSNLNVYSSRISGTTYSVFNNTSNTKIANTMLSLPTDATSVCVASYNTNFVALGTNCQ